MILLVWCFYLNYVSSRSALQRIIKLSVYATVKTLRRNHGVIRRLPGGHRSTKVIAPRCDAREIHRACQLLRSVNSTFETIFRWQDARRISFQLISCNPSSTACLSPVGQPVSCHQNFWRCCRRDIICPEETCFSLANRLLCIVQD